MIELVPTPELARQIRMTDRNVRRLCAILISRRYGLTRYGTARRPRYDPQEFKTAWAKWTQENA